MALTLLFIAAFVLVLVLNDDDEPAGEQAGVTVSDIVNQRGKYLGQTVVVSGAIEEILGEGAFTIRGPEEATGEGLLIVAEDGAIVPLEDRPPRSATDDETVVRVRGVVNNTDLRELSEFGEKIPDDRLEPFGDAPVVMAESITVSPDVPPPSDDEAVTVDDVVEDPKRFRGELTTVGGRVTEELGRNAVIVDGELLVVSPLNPLTTLSEGDLARFIGPVRPFDIEEFERELDVDLKDRLERYEGDPAIAGRAITLEGLRAGPLRPSRNDHPVSRPATQLAGLSERR